MRTTHSHDLARPRQTLQETQACSRQVSKNFKKIKTNREKRKKSRKAFWTLAVTSQCRIWLKRQLLFIVSAMPGPSEVGRNKKCSIVQVKWDADKNGKAYVNTDFPICTDSFLGDARSCEMLKAYLEEAARHETRAREKESLIAYDTQFLV
jgi:hypothetical protein